KTTILTKIANSALEDGKNVLQIVFEDTDDEIRRKHYALWSKIPLSEINDRKDEAEQIVSDHVKNINNKLIIKRFDEDETTIVDIKNWMDTYQKKFGVKFDMVVLDYIDCLEPHKTAVDQNQVELSIIKYFISMAGKYNIPMWTAVQANRSGFNAEFVDQTQMGGNIKRAQKSHLLMSVAKSQEQKRSGLANIQLLKARFAPDGFTFKDCIFNNDTMEIRITDTVPKTRRLNVDNDPEKLENKINNHVQQSKEMFDKNEIKDLLNE
ncbi:MAG: DnaB-like helicase C-terminal domain-containing protein, partial [bacterium]